MALSAVDTSLPALTDGRSVLQVGSAPTPRDIQIPFVQEFTPQQKFSLSYRVGTVLNLMEPYESVKFVSLTFAVEVTGQAGKLQFATTTSLSPPVDDIAWLSATIYQRFTGNAHGDTYAEYVFPTEHPFGTEMKAVSLGNGPPRFFFRFTGTTGDSASVRGKLTIRGGGHGIIDAIPLNPIKETK